MKYHGGRASLVCLGCTVPDRCQNLSSKSGESKQDIPGVVGGIARRGRSHQKDRYVEWCMGSTQEKEPSWVVCPTSIKLFSNASIPKGRGVRPPALCPCHRHRRNPTRGFPSCHLGPWSWWRQWLTPEDRASFDYLPCWPLAWDLVCSWIVTLESKDHFFCSEG